VYGERLATLVRPWAALISWLRRFALPGHQAHPAGRPSTEDPVRIRACRDRKKTLREPEPLLPPARTGGRTGSSRVSLDDVLRFFLCSPRPGHLPAAALPFPGDGDRRAGRLTARRASGSRLTCVVAAVDVHGYTGDVARRVRGQPPIACQRSSGSRSGLAGERASFLSPARASSTRTCRARWSWTSAPGSRWGIRGPVGAVAPSTPFTAISEPSGGSDPARAIRSPPCARATYRPQPATRCGSLGATGARYGWSTR